MSSLEQMYPNGIEWSRVKVLSIDHLRLTLELRDEAAAKSYQFESSEEMDRVMTAWFGSRWTGKEKEPRIAERFLFR